MCSLHWCLLQNATPSSLECFHGFLFGSQCRKPLLRLSLGAVGRRVSRGGSETTRRVPMLEGPCISLCRARCPAASCPNATQARGEVPGQSPSNSAPQARANDSERLSELLTGASCWSTTRTNSEAPSRGLTSLAFTARAIAASPMVSARPDSPIVHTKLAGGICAP